MTTAISNPASFHWEARCQGVCAICGKGSAMHAHHCVFRRWLKQNGLPEFDTRNARRLCPHCNLAFDARSIEFPLTALLDVNLEYAFEVMGAFAYDWLRRFYSGDDPRLEVLLDGVSR